MAERRRRAPAATATCGSSDVTKQFGDFTAVDDLDLTIPQGSFFALLGPSGCGKTTTLRMVAGPRGADRRARSCIGDEDITGAKPYKRPVNTVFQSYALFPHLDIFENVAFGLRRRGSKDVEEQVERDARAGRARQPWPARKPAQLSGGQQQRVALARALINQPEVLLLDEPLGALDLKLRRQMQIELKRIQTEVGLTFVHVTHDQEEAMTMADTIAVMNAGRIEQMGAPGRALRDPAHDVRRQLPRPVQPDRGRGHRHATATTSCVDVHGEQRRRARRPRAHRAATTTCWSASGRRRSASATGGRGARRGGQRARRAASSPTSASSASAPSTSCGCRGARSCMVFEQNTRRRRLLPAGRRRSTCTGTRSTPSCLDAGQDADAGVERIEDAPAAPAGRGADERRRRGRRAPVEEHAADAAAGRPAAAVAGSTPYLLLLPGLLWLVVFFVVPICPLLAPRCRPGRSAPRRATSMTWRFANYPDAL